MIKYWATIVKFGGKRKIIILMIMMLKPGTVHVLSSGEYTFNVVLDSKQYKVLHPDNILWRFVCMLVYLYVSLW